MADESECAHVGEAVRVLIETPKTSSRTKVLIGFADALAAPEVAFSLHDAGFGVKAFTRAGARCSLAALPFIDMLEVPAPERGVARALDGLQRAVDTADAELLMPLDDIALWGVHQLSLRGGMPLGVRPLTPRPDAVGVALDKRLQVEVATRAGLRVPPTLLVGPGASAAEWYGFPCIAKPAEAVTVKDDRIGKGQALFFAEAEAFVNWRAQHRGAPYLVQPFISGTGEGVFGMVRDGRVIGWSGHRRLRMMNPAGSGASACEARRPDEHTKRRVEDFLRACVWEGMFMVELLRDDSGALWFMELNGRPWGSLALARRQGFDYPAWSAKMAVASGFRPAIPEAACGRRLRHLGRDIVHLMFVLRGPRARSLEPAWPRRGAALAQVLPFGGPSSFYNYHPRYPWFFLWDAIWTLWSFLRRR